MKINERNLKKELYNNLQRLHRRSGKPSTKLFIPLLRNELNKVKKLLQTTSRSRDNLLKLAMLDRSLSSNLFKSANSMANDMSGLRFKSNRLLSLINNPFRLENILRRN